MRVESYLQRFAQQDATVVVALPGRESEEIVFSEIPKEQIILPEDENTGGYAAIAASIVKGHTPHWVFYTYGKAPPLSLRS